MTKKTGEKTSYAIGYIIGYGILFLIVAGIIKIICLCFGLTFSWKITLGIYLLATLIKLLFPRVKK